MNKESMINVLKYNFFLEPDGHTIFSPDHFIENGFSPEFVETHNIVYTSGEEPKEKIMIDDKVVDVLEGIYNLDMLYAIARIIEADRTIALSKMGRGFQARALVDAIKDVVQPLEKEEKQDPLRSNDRVYNEINSVALWDEIMRAKSRKFT